MHMSVLPGRVVPFGDNANPRFKFKQIVAGWGTYGD